MATDQIERPRFYPHQYLGAEDLSAEQAYHRDMRRRHNLGHHTWGIVAGLELTEQDVQGQVEVLIQPGLAVDGFGREIVVLQPVALERDLFKGCPDRMHREVWITYDERRTRARGGRSARCDEAGAFGRVREGFRVVAGPQPVTHEALWIAGRAMPLPGAGPLPAGGAPGPAVPPDESVPHQEFPDDETNPRWLIRLGSVLWDAGALNPDGTQGAFLKADPGRLVEGRRHVGAVAAQVLAPAGKLRIKDRPAASPPNDTDDLAAVEGTLRVDGVLTARGDAHVLGNVGIGTAAPAGPLTIRAKNHDQDLVAFEAPDGTATWRVGQSTGGASRGLRIAEAAGSEPRLFVKAGGNVGVGTTVPRNPLAIRATGTWEELLSFEDSNGATRWHINQKPNGNNPGLNVAETGVADYRLFIKAGGNVGIGTDAPTSPLHVTGVLGIRQNRLYLSGGDGWSSLTYNAHHNAGNTGWVFPDPGRTAVTIEMDDALPNQVPRFDVWSTTPVAKTSWRRRFRIEGDTGNVFMADDGGNVGIGTASPTAKLEVAGSMKVDGKALVPIFRWERLVDRAVTYADEHHQPAGPHVQSPNPAFYAFEP